MKVFIVLATFVVAALASPSQLATLPLQAYLRSGIYAPAQAQYHAQDALGQYQYGYSDGLSAKEEIKTFDGITRGSYSYVDANNELQTVDYIADAINGFRVAGTNLPKALPVAEQSLPKQVEETAEVAEAKAAHFAAHQEAKTRTSDYRPAEHVFDTNDLPKQVEDTAEVAKAKADHLAAKKHAELQNSVIQEIRAAPAVYQAHHLGLYPYVSSVNALPAFRAVPALPFLRTAYLPQAYRLV